jgi:hydrogenase maturation protease
MMPGRILVLGIGNRLMCDDGIGVRVVESLGREVSNDGIKFAAGETDVDYCLDVVSDADTCIIIDAARLDGAPCSVRVQDLEETLEKAGAVRTFHEYDLIHAMKREGLIRKGLLITVEVNSVRFSDELSPMMEERFEKIVQEVRELLPI